VVIAVGGGGIPVIRLEDGTLSGRDAVIDKDAASSMLAIQLRASILIFSTSVDRAARHFNTPQQLDIDHMNVAQCRQYLQEGHFLPGSMRPKIESALAFLEAGGERVIITQPDQLEDALQGLCGTHIVP
jgi:carbamate kinase